MGRVDRRGARSRQKVAALRDLSALRKTSQTPLVYSLLVGRRTVHRLHRPVCVISYTALVEDSVVGLADCAHLVRECFLHLRHGFKPRARRNILRGNVVRVRQKRRSVHD